MEQPIRRVPWTALHRKFIYLSPRTTFGSYNLHKVQLHVIWVHSYSLSFTVFLLWIDGCNCVTTIRLCVVCNLYVHNAENFAWRSSCINSNSGFGMPSRTYDCYCQSDGKRQKLYLSYWHNSKNPQKDKKDIYYFWKKQKENIMNFLINHQVNPWISDLYQGAVLTHLCIKLTTIRA